MKQLEVVQQPNEELVKRITKARIDLLLSQPFFGQLCLNLIVEPCNSIETAATDGKTLYYNEKFFSSLTDKQLVFLLIHETMHVALNHMTRKSSRQHEHWNKACDYAIHSLLKEGESDSTYRFAPGALYDSRFDNMSAEEIYERLVEDASSSMGNGQGQGQGQGNKQNQGGGNGKGQNKKGKGVGGGDGTIDDHSLWDDPEIQNNKDKIEREWQEKLMIAADVAKNSSKGRGSLPGGIERLIEKLRRPQLDWRQILQDLMSIAPYDYGFAPPERRMSAINEIFNSDFILPAMNYEESMVENIVFAIDTSGSIGDNELIAFVSEIKGLFDMYSNGVKIHVLYYDTDVAAAYEEIEDVDEFVKCRPAGFGGTDFKRSVIPWIKQKLDNGDIDEVKAIVTLTDGYDSLNDCDALLEKNEVNCDLFWVITSSESEVPDPNCGRTARLKVDKYNC